MSGLMAGERTNQSTQEGRGMENRSLLVLYGSETGHSQEIAEEIGETAERLRFQTSVEPMDDVSLKELVQHSFAVFVTSTTGQGDVPANAIIFWKSLLRKKLPPGCLSQLQFTIFGLGDSSYPKFNWAARKLQKRLVQLGAVEVYPAGEGDERHDNGIDSVYLPWFQGLNSHLLNGLPNGVTPIPDDELLPPKYPIEVDDMALENPASVGRWNANRTKNAALSHIHNPKSKEQEFDDEYSRHQDPSGASEFARAGGTVSDRLTGDGKVRLDNDNILKDHPSMYDLYNNLAQEGPPPNDLLAIPDSFDARLLRNCRITPSDHWQDVRLLDIEVCQSKYNDWVPKLRPGDCLVLYPKNFGADVQNLIDMMGWQSIADKRIVWGSLGERPRCPRNMHPNDYFTLRDVLHHNLDINAVPNRTFLKQLRRHTEDEREKERLLELTQETNTHEFYDYTSRPRRTILEVLRDFPEVKIPVDYALEIFPLIRGRHFSIANHTLDHQDDKAKTRRVQIIVALVEYKTIIRKPRQGLCSRYIKSLRSGEDMVISLKRHSSAPSGEIHARRPLLAVATGTGIAPVKSLIMERDFWKDKGPAVVFFGCRSKTADFYYNNYWERERANNVKIIPTFSRDAINPEDKAFLDPYAEQSAQLMIPGMAVTGKPDPMGPENTPWLTSFDYDRGKMYVQHMIRREAKEVCRIVGHAWQLGVPPIIVICGNAGRMPVSVRHALGDALVIGGLAQNNAQARQMLQDIGIWMETW